MKNYQWGCIYKTNEERNRSKKPLSKKVKKFLSDLSLTYSAEPLPFYPKPQ
jgi:hypothetical protein